MGHPIRSCLTVGVATITATAIAFTPPPFELRQEERNGPGNKGDKKDGADKKE